MLIIYILKQFQVKKFEIYFSVRVSPQREALICFLGTS